MHSYMTSIAIKMSPDSKSTWTFYLITRVLIVDLLGFVSGSVSVWSSPVLAKLAKPDNPSGQAITLQEASWIGSLLHLGAIFGSFISAYSSEKFGRKPTLIAVAVAFAASFTILAFSTHVHAYYIGRIVSGLAFGGHFTVLPVYLVELAGNTNRGIIGYSAIVFLTIGVFVSFAIGPYMSIQAFNLTLLLFPVAFTILFAKFNPESPLYLLQTGHQAKAMEIYRELRGSDDSKEFEEITGKSQWKNLFSKRYLKPVVLTSLLICFKPLAGVNTIDIYTQNIYEAISDTIPAEIPPIIVSGILVVSGCITPIFIERIGRRYLLITSSLGMMVSETVLGGYYYYLKSLEHAFWIPALCLLTTKTFFGFGFGSVVWTVISELLPTEVKSPACAVANCVCWSLTFLLTFGFPAVAERIGMPGSFWIFAGCNLLAAVFTCLFIPETRGKSIKDVQRLLV